MRALCSRAVFSARSSTGNAPADIDRFAQAGCARLTTDRIRKGASVDELCAAALEPGIMKKADTLEELADMLGFAGEAKAELPCPGGPLQRAVRCSS